MKRIEQLVNAKISQWNKEAMMNAQRAIKKNIEAQKVQYPTGLKMMRFAEPFSKEFGMHYEVTPEAWEYLKNAKS